MHETDSTINSNVLKAAATLCTTDGGVLDHIKVTEEGTIEAGGPLNCMIFQAPVRFGGGCCGLLPAVSAKAMPSGKPCTIKPDGVECACVFYPWAEAPAGGASFPNFRRILDPEEMYEAEYNCSAFLVNPKVMAKAMNAVSKILPKSSGARVSALRKDQPKGTLGRPSSRLIFIVAKQQDVGCVTMAVAPMITPTRE